MITVPQPWLRKSESLEGCSTIQALKTLSKQLLCIVVSGKYGSQVSEAADPALRKQKLQKSHHLAWSTGLWACLCTLSSSCVKQVQKHLMMFWGCIGHGAGCSYLIFKCPVNTLWLILKDKEALHKWMIWLDMINRIPNIYWHFHTTFNDWMLISPTLECHKMLHSCGKLYPLGLENVDAIRRVTNVIGNPISCGTRWIGECGACSTL